MNKTAIALGLSIALAGCSTTSETSSTQDTVDAIASSIQVTYQVNQKLEGDKSATCKALGAEWAACQDSTIQLTNNGVAIDSADWEIYFHSIRRILDVKSPEFTIEHINGDLHKITPTAEFKGFAANSTIDVNFIAEYWSLFETDVIPRYYVTAENAEAKVIANTDTENMSDIVKPLIGENLKRHAGDNNIVMNANTRFDKNEATSQLSISTIANKILPTPVWQDDMVTGSADLSEGIQIHAPAMNTASLTAITNRLENFGVNVSGKYPVNVTIAPLKLESEYAKSGGYSLDISDSSAEITAFDNAGALYALQSIASLIPSDFSSNKTISQVSVKDAPNFEYRGMEVDIARNFHSKESLLRLLDQMSAYKLNKFHIHLTDDEGWRLAIPDLPELTDVGAQRCHDLAETTCLLPQLGSGPTTDNRGSGFLSKTDYIELIKYANARNIEVIPEIDMPAHARAGVVAMEARYNKYKDSDLVKAEEYRLADPDDKSVYTTIQFYNDGILNPCIDSTYNFISKVISEVQSMHQEAGQPLKTWHMGGDEAKNIHLGNGYEQTGGTTGWKGDMDLTKQTMPWAKSPQCVAQIAADDSLETTHDLGPLFVKKVANIIAAAGIEKTQLWQDGLKDVDAKNLPLTAVANVWETLYWGGANTSNHMTEKGFEVVQSHPDYLYFDFPHEVNAKERGFYWATRYTDTKKVFKFSPNNLPQNAETSKDRDGNNFSVKGDTENRGYNGISGQLWSEVVRTDSQFEYMVFPRILPLAERAWHKASWELDYVKDREFKGGETSFVDTKLQQAEWVQFANILGQRELAKIDQTGIQYRLPVPGGKIEAGKLIANVEFPGLEVQYSTDSGASWATWTKPIAATSAELRTVSPDGKRFSRVTSVNN
ncbi:carbohydate-binding domain-containing protein [Moritella sp. 24]|uniref:beta-N-acetylhexosaminidase n=1 Tax=Moritella sp. 24 TaxID=2746230 RepID=UPI001BAC10F2|nr:beta-N-acetylhexosaminidase [Moritella sp. 24]QUM76542.1 carbohydate-binding domain-containing protein [Moritella sp. 24]